MQGLQKWKINTSNYVHLHTKSQVSGTSAQLARYGPVIGHMRPFILPCTGSNLEAQTSLPEAVW